MADKASYLVAEDPAVDLQIAEAEVQELEDYILSDVLYRPLIVRASSGDLNLQMTGGDLLTRLHRLRSQRQQLLPDLQTRVDTVDQAARRIIYSLRTRFHARLQREMKARLDSLKWFLDDCGQDRQRCRVEYPFEVRNRQRIEEILKESEGDLPEELKNYLRTIDQRVRVLTHATDFIWDAQLQEAFPRQPYWYLYASP
jgi:hypothetical protein